MSGGEPIIGLDMFHYATIVSDSSTGVSYAVPVHVPNLTNANINFNGNIATFFADNGPRVVYSQLGEVDLEIAVADLPPEDYAAVIGATREGGIVKIKSTDLAPALAVGFRAQKSNGEYRYIWLTKGKFAVPDASHKTKTNSPEFQGQTIKGKFVAREYDDMVCKRADTDDDDFTLASSWFDAVETTPDALTCTPSPADGATSVAVDGSITWTFSNAVQNSFVDSAYFTVTKDDGTAIAGTLSVNAAGTVVTFSPTENLSNSTTYLAMVSNAVKDVYGQQVGSNTIIDFTTVAAG